MEQIKENKMGTEPMLKLILSMSLPAMFSMLVQALYNIVDSYFVAQISEEALTAVSLAFPLQMLMISVAVGTGIGINSLVSRRLGQKQQAAADKAATHGIFLAVFSWIAFALIGIFGTKAFFHAFTQNPNVLQMGCDYTYIVLIFSVGIFVEINIEKTLQATGNMIYPMVFQLVGAITNIILDPILIFGLLGMPKMGIAGAAAATVIGQILSMLVSIYVVFRKDHIVHITFKKFRFEWATIRDIYAVGVPSIIMQSIGSVMTTILNGILIVFSEAAVAVLGVYFKLQSFIFMPVFGMTHGVMPIMGYNFGAGNKKRLLSALKIGCILALCIMAVGTAIFMIFPRQLLMIFNASDAMMEIGIHALRTICLCFLPAALGIMFSTLFQAVGSGNRSLVISILRQLVIIVPVAYLMSKIGLYFVWIAFPIAEVFSFVVSIWMYALLYKKSIHHLGESKLA